MTRLEELLAAAEARIRSAPPQTQDELFPEPEGPKKILTPWQEALQRARVPPAYLEVPEDLALPPELAALARWAEDPVEWSVTLFGPKGSGKTWRAVWLLGTVACRGVRRCRFIDSVLWLQQLKEAIGTDRDGVVWNRAALADVLLLDDLGAERATEYQRDQINTLLRDRFNARRRTIVTTNATGFNALATNPDGSGGPLDARMVSRLSAGISKRIDGPDRRPQRRATS